MSASRHVVVVIRGDGIGPEIVDATWTALDATGVPLEPVNALAGEAAVAEMGAPLPLATLEAMADVGVVLKAPLISPASTGPVATSFRGRAVCHSSVNAAFRRALGLYANVRRIRSFPGVASVAGAMDVAIVRETTEGSYAGIGHRIGDVAAETVRLITRQATQRIVRFAIEFARRQGRNRVTLGHKAHVMPDADGFFLEVAREVAAGHDDIAFDEMHIDALGAACVSNPGALDVVVLENQYGDVISDVAGAAAGSIGLAPGANHGDEAAVFEPSHGAAPDIAGHGIANPLGLVLSAASMLAHLGEHAAATAVEEAVRELLADGAMLPPDLGGQATSREIGEELARRIAARAPRGTSPP